MRDVVAAPAELAGAADAVFGQRLALAERFAGHLASSGVERGLVGPHEVPRLWERHLLNCAVVAELIPAAAAVIDIGSGAGLPGIALAIARPDLEITLVEPLLRRVTWLGEVLAALGLSEVAVVRARAEDVARAEAADVVTARAVANLARLAELSWPLLRRGGSLLAIKGRSAGAEVEAAEPTLRRLGAEGWAVLQCGEWLSEPTRVVRVTRGST